MQSCKLLLRSARPHISIRPCCLCHNSRDRWIPNYGGTTSVRQRQLKSGQSRGYNTSLYKSDALEQTCPVDLDLDLQSKLADVQKLEQLLKRRGVQMNVDSLVSDYHRLVELQQKKVELDAVKKGIAMQMKELSTEQKKNKSKDLSDKLASLKQEGRSVKDVLKPLVREMWLIEERVILQALTLPNNLLPDTPLQEPRVTDEFFADNKPTTQESHLELVEKTGNVKFSPVGLRAYYLKGSLAQLEQDLIEHFTQEILNRGYTQMLCPEIFKTPVVEGYGFNIEDSSEVFRLEQTSDNLQDSIADRLYLRGSSQLSFLAYFMRILLKKSDLPLNVFSVGRTYLPENNDGTTLPGLFGALQSVKFTGCSICTDDAQMETMLSRLREDLVHISKALHLPMRLVALPASSLLRSEMYKEELQMWAPSLHDYVKVGSVGVTGDFCSRRLMIRYTEEGATKPVLMVHAELVDITRLIALFIEHGRSEWKLG